MQSRIFFRFVTFALAVYALAALAGCHHARPPLPAGEWAYRYADGTIAFYEERQWVRGTCVAPVLPRPAPAVPRLSAAAPSTFSWVSPMTDVVFASMATGAGIVYNAHCTVQTIAASETLYIFFVDTSATTQPANGASAINGGVSGGMTAVGNDVSFTDQTNPALAFTNGIMLAASTTPDTYTAPTSTDKVRCDIKIRSSAP